jgi:hypothetical protein
MWMGIRRSEAILKEEWNQFLRQILLSHIPQSHNLHHGLRSQESDFCSMLKIPGLPAMAGRRS